MSECNCPRIDVQVLPAPVIDIQSGIGPQGPAGHTPVKGVDYTDGADGTTFTPAVSSAGVISWTNDGGKTNPQSVNIKGPQGPAGQDGQPGRDGQDGAPGQDGQDGVSPTIAVTDITGGHRVTITDATGAHSFDVMNGDDADAPVQDVQVNGTSVLQDGVANVPKAAVGVLGAVSVNNSYGLAMRSDGTIYIYGAPANDYKTGMITNRAACLNRLDKVAYYGLAKAAGADMKDVTGETFGVYPEAQKSAISEMLNGPVSVSGTTPSINALPGIQYICGEVSTLDITLPASGCVDVVFQSGATPTVLTITPPTGMTVKWANGFDPTSLEANTTYEIRILNGQFATATAWN